MNPNSYVRYETTLECSDEITRREEGGSAFQKELHGGYQAEQANLDRNPQIRTDSVIVSLSDLCLGK